MELTSYRRELVTRVQEMAIDEGLLDQEAFFQVVQKCYATARPSLTTSPLNRDIDLVRVRTDSWR